MSIKAEGLVRLNAPILGAKVAANLDEKVNFFDGLNKFVKLKLVSNNIIVLNIMPKIALKNVVWKEGKHYVSWNINTGVSSFGSTKKEALLSLQEALELHLEDVPFAKI